jgi:hypothetical protein
MYLFIETESGYMAQGSLELTIYPRLALNSGFSILPNVGLQAYVNVFSIKSAHFKSLEANYFSSRVPT